MHHVSGGPRQSVHLVSPPYACGVAWLVNALLALNIRTSNANFLPHWEDRAEGSEITHRAQEHLKWHLPLLHERAHFDFPEQLEIHWEHRLDFAAQRTAPTILFVRDPRDAIYSMYRRNYAEESDFETFLDRADTWPDHFPGLFGLPAFETYTFFVEYWLAQAAQTPLLLIRFEDTKRQPDATLKRVLDFLGLERQENELAAASASSSFARAKQAMEAMSSTTGKQFVTARSGRLDEWKEVFSPAALSRISPSCLDLMKRLGYADGVPQASAPTSPEPILDARLPANAAQLATGWVKDCLGGKPYDAPRFAREITAFAPDQETLIRLGLVLRSLFYVHQIFPDGGKSAAGIALTRFLWLNLRYAEEPSIARTANLSLSFLEKTAGFHYTP